MNNEFEPRNQQERLLYAIYETLLRMEIKLYDVKITQTTNQGTKPVDVPVKEKKAKKG